MLQTAGTYEVYIESDRSSGLLFYGNGTIDVTGGGSVGDAGAAINGSAGCYSTAGATPYVPPAGSARRLSLGGSLIRFVVQPEL